jgi:hypothetical protein
MVEKKTEKHKKGDQKSKPQDYEKYKRRAAK